MKRSALYHLHRHLGATFSEWHGWEMPSTFATPQAEATNVENSVGLADLSYRPKYEAQRDSTGKGWRLTEGRYFLVGEPPMEKPADSVDITSVYASLLLAGPHSQSVLRKLTSLNLSDARLPNLSCRQASVGHVHTTVLREDLARVKAYHLLVTRDYAESFWETVSHAGEEFGLRPFGLMGLERLRV